MTPLLLGSFWNLSRSAIWLLPFDNSLMIFPENQYALFVHACLVVVVFVLFNFCIYSLQFYFIFNLNFGFVEPSLYSVVNLSSLRLALSLPISSILSSFSASLSSKCQKLSNKKRTKNNKQPNAPFGHLSFALFVCVCVYLFMKVLYSLSFSFFNRNKKFCS